MKTLTLFAAPILLAAPAFAQFELPKPDESLAPFAATVGHWEGKGTFSMDTVEERMPWTCTIELEPILDGFAYQETLDVDMGEIGHYHMMAIYTYDAAKSQLVHIKTDNMGGTAMGLSQWVGNSLVSAGAGMFPQMDGSKLIGAERGVWAIDGDSSTLSITMVSGDQAASIHVDGVMKRTNPKPMAVNASLRTNELIEPMKPLASMLGKWHMKGSMVMAPDAPKMEIAGNDDVFAFTGGHAIVANVIGEESEGFIYRAIGTMSWSESKSCWDHYSVDNMGVVTHSEWFQTDDETFVMMHSGSYMGEPYAERGTFKVGKDGPISVWSDRFSGAGAGARVFEGTYSKAK
tara:strand:- start:5140 stop:6180 length:1041 start_codon:yes stop_codon:yes gene_type:complete